MALTAVVTDHWIVPTGQTLPFVSHAGLWKVCFTAAATQADGRDASNVDTFNDIDDWWSAVSESYLDVPDRRVALQVGCTRTVAELYAHVWGEDRLAWLQICRAFAVLYLWCGFLKVATVTRNYAEASAGRWLSSALAVSSPAHSCASARRRGSSSSPSCEGDDGRPGLSRPRHV